VFFSNMELKRFQNDPSVAYLETRFQLMWRSNP
jgi:hypothetical protein